MDSVYQLGVEKNVGKPRVAVDMFMKFLKGDTTPVTNVDERVKNELRQAVYNKEMERRYPDRYYVDNIVDNINSGIRLSNNTPINRLLNALGLGSKEDYLTRDSYLGRNISYENYNPIRLGDRVMGGSAPTSTTGNAVKALYYNDPSYNAQNYIGRANYNITPTGDVVLTDRYNFNKGLHMGSPILDILHTIGKYKRQNGFDTVLNLGNINDWNMEYTGNGYNRPISSKEDIMGYGTYEKGYGM